MSSRAQYVVLVEDAQAQVFVGRALKAAGAKRIRFVALPFRGKGGGGHGFVIRQYAQEVAARRSQSALTGLVVHVDADNRTVVERHQQLAAELKAAGVAARRPDEPIAELIPKRNIETWIYALDEELALERNVANPLDEETDYKDRHGKLDRPRECAVAAITFAEHARHRTYPEMAGAIPSLRDGIDELRRLPLW